MNPAADPAERSGQAALPGLDYSVRPARADGLWEQVFAPANLMRALKRVERNRGAPGADGMTTAMLRPFLREHWAGLRGKLDAGTYRPAPVRRVMIPKPGGGQRKLGVPTALDRLIQQAIAQALTPIFDPSFSGSSFGFRPGRSAHQAVRAGRRCVEDGLRWVVDVDLDSFFDRVQFDVLMARVARKVADRRLLRLIRAYLEAGIMVDGVKLPAAEGTPQGSPLSPLLSNIMLDDLDRVLWQRGHRFVRYADDVRVFVRSERAAQRVLGTVTDVVENQLKLKVNQAKSSIRHASQATLLGFGFYFTSAGPRIRVAPKAITRMRQRLRELTRRAGGIAMEIRIGQINSYLAGWCGYFALADTPQLFKLTDHWLRRRLRAVRWKEWKHTKGRIRALTSLGAKPATARRWARTSKGPWRISRSHILHTTLRDAYWDDQGLLRFEHRWRELRNA